MAGGIEYSPSCGARDGVRALPFLRHAWRGREALPFLRRAVQDAGADLLASRSGTRRGTTGSAGVALPVPHGAGRGRCPSCAAFKCSAWYNQGRGVPLFPRDAVWGAGQCVFSGHGRCGHTGCRDARLAQGADTAQFARPLGSPELGDPGLQRVQGSPRVHRQIPGSPYIRPQPKNSPEWTRGEPGNKKSLGIIPGRTLCGRFNGHLKRAGRDVAFTRCMVSHSFPPSQCASPLRSTAREAGRRRPFPISATPGVPGGRNRALC